MFLIEHILNFIQNYVLLYFKNKSLDSWNFPSPGSLSKYSKFPFLSHRWENWRQHGLLVRSRSHLSSNKALRRTNSPCFSNLLLSQQILCFPGTVYSNSALPHMSEALPNQCPTRSFNANALRLVYGFIYVPWKYTMFRGSVYSDEYMGLHGLWDHFGEASPFNGANHLTSLRLSYLIFTIGMSKYLCQSIL